MFGICERKRGAGVTAGSFLCLLRNKVNKSNHYAHINHRRADFFIVSTLSPNRLYMYGRALWCSTLCRIQNSL